MAKAATAKKEKPAAAAVAPVTKAAAAAKPAKEPKPAKVEQNGVTRPAAHTTTGKIWDIADKISAKLKAPAPRASVMEQTKALGINDATAATQYGKWRKFNGLEGKVKAPAAAAAK